jgi:hypothetical protein
MKTRRRTCAFVLLLLLAGTSRLPASQSAPSALAQTPAQSANAGSITGEWQGMVGRLRLIVNIELASDGTFRGKLISADQGKMSIPINAVSFSPSRLLRLEMKSIGAVYEGKLSDDGSRLTGTWQRGGNSAPLSLHRPGATATQSALKPRTIGRITFEPSRSSDGNTDGLCSKYEVYENRKSQTGRKIALNIMVLPSLSDQPPHEASAQAAKDLSDSRVVVVKDGTHRTGSPCIDGLISEFVAQGSAVGLDVSCVDQIHLPPFLTPTQVDPIQQKSNTLH